MNKPAKIVDKVKHSYAVPVAANGRMNLPADIRRALGIEGAGKVFLERDGDTVQIITFAQRLARIDAMMKPYIKPGQRLSDELIAERRAENAKEEAEHEEWKRRQRG